MPPSIRSKRGFSLVEILISIVLIAALAVAVLTYIIHFKNFSVRADHYSQATEFLVRQLETLASYDYDDPALDTDLANPDNNPHRPTLPASKLKDAAMEYTVTEGQWSGSDTGSKYKKIVATITWNEDTGRSLSLTSLVRKQ